MEGYYTGFISSIDAVRGFVRVTYPQENNTVSDWLPLLAHEYNMPEPGEYVATIIDKNMNGVCLGKIFSYSQPPKQTEGYGKSIDNINISKRDGTFKIDFGDASIEYRNGVITITADKIVLNEQ